LWKPRLFRFVFFIGYVPVVVGANLPISIGLDFEASATASVSLNSPLHSTGIFDYTCTFKGCTGDASFDSQHTPGTQPITAGLSGRIKPSPWVQLALRGYLYHDSIAHAQLGVRPYLLGDLWGYFGNNCGDADSDGSYEHVDALTFDLDSQVKLTAKVAALGDSLKKEWNDIWHTSRAHHGFWDLLGGSSALEPMLNGPDTVPANSSQQYLASMRPCWPYGDRVNYRLDWGDGAISDFAEAPNSWHPESHSWLQAGIFNVGLRAVSDDHGRDLNAHTARSIEVTAPVPPPSSNCVTPPSGLAAWWPGDSDASDLQGANHGILRGSATAGAAGKVSGAFDLDGSSAYVQVADDNALDVSTGDFALAMWINTTDAFGVKVLVDKRREGSSGVQGYALYLASGRLGFQLADGVGSSYCSSDPSTSSCTNYGTSAFVADGSWHFIVVTIDRDDTAGLKFYVDGALVGTGNPTIRPNSLSNSYPLRIGSRSSSISGLFNGSIDEVALFNRALTAQEIQSILAAGSDGMCK
jgi:hypothetical protein